MLRGKLPFEFDETVMAFADWARVNSMLGISKLQSQLFASTPWLLVDLWLDQ